MALLGTGSCRRRRSITLDAAWPDGEIPHSRIVECDDFASSEAAANPLRDAGYKVAVCTAPDALHRNPLLKTGRCALVERGPVVINLLGFSPDTDRGHVLPHLRSRYPDIPIVVELSASQRETHWAVVAGGCVVDSPVRRDSLLARVAAADSARS